MGRPQDQHKAIRIPGSNRVGFWVGLGGYGTNNLLQAGTAATLSGSGVSLLGLDRMGSRGLRHRQPEPQSRGHGHCILVCAPETDHGFVSMMNQRINQAISVGVSRPTEGTTPYDSSTVEWIVRKPIDNEGSNFGNVIFKEISAGTKHHTINLAKAFALNATLGGTTLMTGKVLLSQNDVKVIWDAAN